MKLNSKQTWENKFIIFSAGVDLKVGRGGNRYFRTTPQGEKP